MITSGNPFLQTYSTRTISGQSSSGRRGMATSHTHPPADTHAPPCPLLLNNSLPTTKRLVQIYVAHPPAFPTPLDSPPDRAFHGLLALLVPPQPRELSSNGKGARFLPGIHPEQTVRSRISSLESVSSSEETDKKGVGGFFLNKDHHQSMSSSKEIERVREKKLQDFPSRAS